MKVLIVEDEAPAFRRLQKILEEVQPGTEIVEVIDSVEETVKWLENHHPPDLIFMDIQLSDGISFELFDRVKITRPVIFTTAFDEYMLRAFKVNSIDYLLKPIKPEDLKHSLHKYHELKTVYANGVVDLHQVVKQIHLGGKDYKTRFLVKLGDKMMAVQTEHIAYFYLRHGVVHLVTDEGKKYLLDQSLEELCSQLDPAAFYRANRQYIVCFRAIKAVHRYHKGKLLVEAGPGAEEQVVISAEKATDFKKWLGE